MQGCVDHRYSSSGRDEEKEAGFSRKFDGAKSEADQKPDGRVEESERRKYVSEQTGPASPETDKKDLDEDGSDFTIAIIKDGKKIGERKVDKLQATRYLVKPKIAPNFYPASEPIQDTTVAAAVATKPKVAAANFYPNAPPPSFMRESELKSDAAEPDDVLLKSAIFPNNVPLSTDGPKAQATSSKTEDVEKPDNIVEYNKITRKPAAPADEFHYPNKGECG